MTTRLLSAALAVLLFSTPLAAAWCSACAVEPCDMMERRDDEPQTRSTESTEATASHCGEMAAAATGGMDELAHQPTDVTGVRAVTFRADPACCAIAASPKVEFNGTPAYSMHSDAQDQPMVAFASIEQGHQPRLAALDEISRPPPSLYTLHSILLI